MWRFQKSEHITYYAKFWTREICLQDRCSDCSSHPKEFLRRFITIFETLGSPLHTRDQTRDGLYRDFEISLILVSVMLSRDFVTKVTANKQKFSTTYK